MCEALHLFVLAKVYVLATVWRGLIPP